MNRIRKWMEDHMDEIRMVLERAYLDIARYQKNADNKSLEAEMRSSIKEAVYYFKQFKSYLPLYKQRYFDILEHFDELELSNRDLIMTFDRAVYELHTRLENAAATVENPGAWSERMRELLDGRRAIRTFQSEESGNKTVDYIASGMSVTGGRVIGPVCKVSDSFDAVNKGDILISRMTTPDVVVVIDRIAGMITEQGEQFCHAAILAREFGIPCVVGCGPFMSEVEDGESVILDADMGVLWRGCNYE